jgi:hypothetical protein
MPAFKVTLASALDHTRALGRKVSQMRVFRFVGLGGLGRKNKRKSTLTRLFETAPTAPDSHDSHDAATTNGQLGSNETTVAPTRVSGRLQKVGLLLLWAMPLVAAAIAFAVPLIGVRAYEYVMTSGYFHVREVIVDQSSTRMTMGSGQPYVPYLSKNEILEIAGIGPGTHLLEADIDAMTARLVAHPWIRWAKVVKDLPDVLVIHVVEHIPSAFVSPFVDNIAGLPTTTATTPGLFLVDELGQVFAPAPADRVLALPVITGMSLQRLEDVQAATAVRQELEAGLNLLRLWESHGLSRRYPVGELRLMAGATFGLVLEIADTSHAGRGGATEVVLGRGPFREKLLRLEWILEHLYADGKTAEYILLDVVDALDQRAIALGGARVVVKADLARDTVEALDEMVRRVPIAPAPAPAAPERRAARPREPAAVQPEPAQQDVVIEPAAEPEPFEPPAENPHALEADTPSEVAPLTGGRPAEDFGEE